MKTNRERATELATKIENLYWALPVWTSESVKEKVLITIAEVLDKAEKRGRRKEREWLFDNVGGTFMGKPYVYWIELENAAKLNRMTDVIYELAELKNKQPPLDMEKVSDEDE